MMKLHEILQEGAFDRIGVEREADTLPMLVKMDDRQLTAYLKGLSEELFNKLKTLQVTRFRQMQRLLNSATERLREIERKYPNDMELSAYNLKDDHNKRVFLGPVGLGHGSREPYQYRQEVAVRAGSDAEKSVNKLLRHHEKYERIRRESSLTPSFEKEAKRRVKVIKQAAIKAAGGKFDEWSQMSGKISEVEMPKKLPKHSSAKPSLLNPAAYENATEVYTGHPAHYPNWSPDWKRRILNVEEALERNGKRGLQLMYAARINKGQRKQPRGYFNFYIIGADGDFVWRKYQTSGANGGNWLYMDHIKKNGGRMTVTDFERMSKEKQDEIIAQV